MARLVLSSPQPFCSPECSESGCDISITKCAAGADDEADVVDADEDTDDGNDEVASVPPTSSGTPAVTELDDGTFADEPGASLSCG